ncbi:photosynthetic NDH subunit of subcomplex B 2, chloroplastic [Canna indica]|uniref:Photosynthetic NDH subunit of subcomplex B 2, chloroplastic n=1 Tax=Canna indica TaxID=4628 RepID=A0AAQ3K700_9LILI|nr:photosynthetic NDH subunit of subcomplex B 2, chloroplastic [Canna indica]
MASSLLSLHLPKPNNPSFSTRATSAPSTTTTTTTESLQERFGRKGIKFTESGDVPSVELSVRNGSSLRLRIPDGLITSYKPKVYWKDDGFEEVLYTTGGGGSLDAPRGGMGLVLHNLSKTTPGGSPWTASEWVVKDADSDSFDAVQVELSCSNGDGSLEVTYVVSLYPVSMATAVVVKNKGKKPVELTSAILSHLKFKSQGKSAIHGLRGCSYLAHPPPSSSFGLLSQADAMKPEPSSWFGSGNGKEAKDWTVEDDLYTILRGKLSRVYAAPPEERVKRIYNTPPSKYTTIDQSSGLGFRVIRMGYEDIYLCAPGSFSQRYGKDYFICTGPASMIVPVVLNPSDEWRAAQVIEHDNL